MNKLLEKFPETGSEEFKLKDIIQINHKPHPYCITGKHAIYASNHYGGMLSETAIRNAEKSSDIKCGMYVNQFTGEYYNGYKAGCKQCSLSYDEHTSDTVLVIKIFTDKELNEIFGLEQYLKSIVDKLEEFKIAGVVFTKDE